MFWSLCVIYFVRDCTSYLVTHPNEGELSYHVSTGLILFQFFLATTLLEGWNSLQTMEGLIASTWIKNPFGFFNTFIQPKLNRQNEAENTTIVICEVNLSLGLSLTLESLFIPNLCVIAK